LSRFSIHESIESLEVHEQRVNQYSKQQWSRLFLSKLIFLTVGEQVFIKNRKEEDLFLEKTHIEQQVKVRIAAAVKVEAEEEEERIFNQE
jgi:hypothetical protein